MKKKIEKEAQAAMDWLGHQPGVTSVILGKRPTATRHHHKPGFTRVTEVTITGVRLQTYGVRMYYEVFANAQPSQQRDTWVAKLAGGDVLGGPNKTKFVAPPPTNPTAGFPSDVPTPEPINETAGQTFDVTPELAAKWLERNTANRPLRGEVVQRYASDMKSGLWQVTGDAIGFDTNGTVVNGQHRLWAVFESGMTVRMLVCFDLDPKVVRVLDDHFKRKLSDVVKISNPGINVHSKHTAAARTMMFNLSRTDRYSAAKKTSRQEQMMFLERHLPAIDFAFRDCLHSRNDRALTTTSIVAVLARAYYSRDKERLLAFGKVFLSGMPVDNGDQAAIIFRNWLMRLENQKVRAATEVIYRKGERALDAFLRKEQIKNLFEATEEMFLLPEETAPASKKITRAQREKAKKP
jgi:hypothetical protein